MNICDITLVPLFDLVAHLVGFYAQVQVFAYIYYEDGMRMEVTAVKME